MDPEDGEPLTGKKRYGQFFKNYWRMLIVIIVPIIALPIFLLNNKSEFHCLYVVTVMAFYWVFEALPLPVTSLIPIVAFPLFGILSTDATCTMYFKSAVVMFLCGIILAEAIEFSNLHKRIALATISFIGCSLRKLLIGFTVVTTFISMWIVNTAATAMMCPIILAVLEELEKEGLCKVFREGSRPKEGETTTSAADPIPSRITVCFFCTVAYTSTIGGIGTLIGTGTNLSLAGIYESNFPNADPIDFVKFSAYALPLMVIQSALICFWMQLVYLGLFRPKSEDAKVVNIGKEGEKIALDVIKTRYNAMGPVTAHEIAVALCFVLAIALFITRDPGFMPGWVKFFPGVKITDSSVAIFLVILFFLIPASWECLRFCTKRSDVPRKTTSPLVTWNFISAKTPWGLLFLLGAGFALAEGGNKSGMSKMLGEALSGLKHLHTLLVLTITVIVCELMTEMTSNVAIANIILPVLAEMALVIEIHPLYLMLPAGLACSMAFHLPVGTPPNALVAGVAYIPTKDLMLAGIGPSILTSITLVLWAISWGTLIYPDSNTFPDWAKEIRDNNGSNKNV